jgi:predicted PolB exonuclease-like 3'-5' exonuclease
MSHSTPSEPSIYLLILRSNSAPEIAEYIDKIEQKEPRLLQEGGAFLLSIFRKNYLANILNENDFMHRVKCFLQDNPGQFIKRESSLLVESAMNSVRRSLDMNVGASQNVK